MKKIIFTAAAVIALAGSSFAQKATLDNPWSLEGGINFSGANGINWQAPTIRARYFVNENIAARVQLGLGDGAGTPMSKTERVNEFNNGTGGVGEIVTKNNTWNAQLGGEYHLAGTDRLSPFFSLGINFGGGNVTITEENVNFGAFSSGWTSEEKIKTNMFGVAVGAGIDFYVVENLYIGLELGLNFNRQNFKDEEYVKTSPGGVSVKTITAGKTQTVLETTALNTGLRLGWRF
ncbi:MAG: outer membrane beta-barrel protein [Crocinitomicaceae bacterium]|nr:outer membrane beta-barrel protein [Crocinitomicaceae bacterium]